MNHGGGRAIGDLQSPPQSYCAYCQSYGHSQNDHWSDTPLRGAQTINQNQMSQEGRLRKLEEQVVELRQLIDGLRVRI